MCFSFSNLLSQYSQAPGNLSPSFSFSPTNITQMDIFFINCLIILSYFTLPSNVAPDSHSKISHPIETLEIVASWNCCKVSDKFTIFQVPWFKLSFMSQIHLSIFSLSFLRSIASSLSKFSQYSSCHCIVLLLVPFLPVFPVAAPAAPCRIPSPRFVFLPLAHLLHPNPALGFPLPYARCLGLSVISNLTISFPELVQDFRTASMEQKCADLRTNANTARAIGRKRKRLGKNEPAATTVTWGGRWSRLWMVTAAERRPQPPFLLKHFLLLKVGLVFLIIREALY